MRNLDDVSEQIQEDITAFTDTYFGHNLSSLVDELCDIVKDRINEYKKTKENANAKLVQQFVRDYA
tara:strand:- start:20 stop:217 length:198 start_codon:yes stop_codon:yes gene_type:complete